MGSLSGIGRAIQDNPERLLFGAPGVLAGASKVRKKERAAAEQRKTAVTQQKLETERKTAEAETSALAQKERARRRTLFAGAAPEQRPSLFSRRLGGTRGGLSQKLGGNVQ